MQANKPEEPCRVLAGDVAPLPDKYHIDRTQPFFWYDQNPVVKIEHQAGGPALACLVVDKHRLQDPEAAARFCEGLESYQLASGHPYIVPLLASHEDSHSIYLLMQLCTGGPLFSPGRARPTLPAQTVAKYTSQIASAVQHCHTHGILHQNITGESIWLTNSTENADAMLAGFELSCFCTARQHASSLVGDVHFMAPEMFERDYSFPINSHALGVVLYSMLAGQLPYKGMDATETRQAIISADNEMRRTPRLRLKPAQILNHPFVKGKAGAAASQKARSRSTGKSRAASSTAPGRSHSAPRTRTQASAGIMENTDRSTQAAQGMLENQADAPAPSQPLRRSARRAEQQKLLNEAAHTLMDFTRVEDDAAAALLALCELDESAQSPVHESKSPSSPLQPASAQFPVHGSRSPLAPLHSSAAEDSGDASLTPVDLTSRADSAAAAPPHVTGVSVSPASGGKPANDTGTNAAYRSDNKAASIKQKAHLHRDSNDQDFSARQMPNPQSDCSTSTHLLLPAAKPAKLSVGTGAPTAKPQSSALMRACALLDAPVKIGDPVRSAGISHHDQSQHANATRIAYEMQLRNAEQNSRHVPSLDFPAGVRPFRTDKEREDYVTPFTKPLTDTHQQIGPALLDMMKQPAWQAKQKERQHPHTSVSDEDKALQDWLLTRQQSKVPTQQPAEISSPPPPQVITFEAPQTQISQADFESAYFRSLRSRVAGISERSGPKIVQKKISK